MPFGLEPKAVFAALGTFLAVDTYVLTFYPRHIEQDDAIDPYEVQSKVSPRRRDAKPSVPKS
jgi:hypothetical protein